MRHVVSRRVLPAAVALASALASALPVAADPDSTQTLECQSSGTGLIIITVNGEVVTRTTVPGPCSAPAPQAPG